MSMIDSGSPEFLKKVLYWDDMSDDEIRILGTTPDDEKEPPPPDKRRKIYAGCFSALIGIIFISIMVFYCLNEMKKENKSADLEYIQVSSSENLEKDLEARNMRTSQQTQQISLQNDGFAYIVPTDTVVGHVAMQVLRPVGGRIELRTGPLPLDDPSVIMACQAADYRADNGQIVGSFVCRGELLARGHSKLGFCAIIGNEVTMGMSRETPLFERAVEQGGSFFRHYALVHDGALGERTPLGTSIRRALCYDGKSLFVVGSKERITYQALSEALIQMGVREAIALVGTREIPLYVDQQEHRFTGSLADRITLHPDAKASYLVWVKE